MKLYKYETFNIQIVYIVTNENYTLLKLDGENKSILKSKKLNYFYLIISTVPSRKYWFSSKSIIYGQGNK